MSDVISFGTDGWRAIIAENFTFHNVERAVYAMGLYIKDTYYKSSSVKVPVLIGYDTRFLADKFAHHAAQILMDMGLNARLSRRDIPTPAIAWSTQHEPTAGALQFTASHNPPEYCGLKYIPHYAGPATNDITNQIIGHLQDLPAGYEVPSREVEYFDAAPPYLAALEKLLDRQRIAASSLKIGYDALYSTSRDYLDRAIADCGLPVTVLHNWRDPLFGGGMPEPKAEYLKDLMALVKKEGLAIGVATDGDADRFSVIDEQGNFFSPNQLLCLLTRHLVKNRGERGAIVRTVATTHLLDRLAKLYGLDLIETPVGFKYIGEIMRSGDVLIGGEESGGVSIKGHIPEKDGILASLLLIEMLAYESKPLTQVWNELLSEVGTNPAYLRGDLKINHRTQKALMQQLFEKPLTTLAGEKVTKISRLDGLKFYLNDQDWLLIRPSGTEPLIRLCAEGAPAERMGKVMLDFQNQVEIIVKELESSRSTTDRPALKSAR